LTANDIILIQK